MYTRMDNSGVEDICYEQEHVEEVLAAIKANFDEYFMRFLDSTGGKGISLDDIQNLQKKFGIEVDQKKKNYDYTENFKTIRWGLQMKQHFIFRFCRILMKSL